MLDIEKLIIRPAELKDLEFLATTIVEAEKSGTDKIGAAALLNIDEEEYKSLLVRMLEEEVDGCEVSMSSFVVAEYDGKTVAARGGWLEGDNEEEMPSAVLKGNLLAYVLPREMLKRERMKVDDIKDFRVERTLGTYQLENSYTIPAFRGQHIMARLDEWHISLAKKKGAKKVQAHIYENNSASIRTLERRGFSIVRKVTSDSQLAKDIYPDTTMLLLELDL